MPFSLEYLDQALADAEAAARWYAERSARAAARFSAEVDEAEDGPVSGSIGHEGLPNIQMKRRVDPQDPVVLKSGQIGCKVAAALAAGCSMVLKPSELAPLNAHIVAEIMDAAGVAVVLAATILYPNTDAPGSGR